MDTVSSIVLALLRQDERTTWVANQLAATFAEGVPQSADIGHGSDADSTLPHEQKAGDSRRRNYDSTRPLREDEKLSLVRFALRELFVTLPAMQRETARMFRELGSGATEIEFLTPDNEERPEASYSERLDERRLEDEDLRRRVEAFTQVLPE